MLRTMFIGLPIAHMVSRRAVEGALKGDRVRPPTR